MDVYLTDKNPLPLPELGWNWTVVDETSGAEVGGTEFKLSADIVLDKDDEVVTETPDSVDGLRVGWTHERISCGLAEWTSACTGRTINYRWVPFEYIPAPASDQESFDVSRFRTTSWADIRMKLTPAQEADIAARVEGLRHDMVKREILSNELVKQFFGI